MQPVAGVPCCSSNDWQKLHTRMWLPLTRLFQYSAAAPYAHQQIIIVHLALACLQARCCYGSPLVTTSLQACTILCPAAAHALITTVASPLQQKYYYYHLWHPLDHVEAAWSLGPAVPIIQKGPPLYTLIHERYR